ncbi:hypothetical protein HJD18_05665 [Thermoleophilia bacterium SCSIO 60948]|nr:hypothetical protein HJD18_05665 [Thermoleophilia bacterium SCSIO 60948]
MRRKENEMEIQAREGHEAVGGGELTIRRATPADRAAIGRLAERDSSPVPEGDVLIAEVGERAVAAISLDDATAVADPFEHSAGALALLRMRSRQLRRRRRGRRDHAGSHGRGSLAGSPPGAGGRLLVLPPR